MFTLHQKKYDNPYHKIPPQKKIYEIQVTGFPLPWLQKIPGLSRPPEAFFQDLVVGQKCLNIATNSS